MAVLFNPYRSSVKLSLKVLYTVPGPLSSSNEHIILKCFMLFFLKPLLSCGSFRSLNFR